MDEKTTLTAQFIYIHFTDRTWSNGCLLLNGNSQNRFLRCSNKFRFMFYLSIRFFILMTEKYGWFYVCTKILPTDFVAFVQRSFFRLQQKKVMAWSWSHVLLWTVKYLLITNWNRALLKWETGNYVREYGNRQESWVLSFFYWRWKWEKTIKIHKFPLCKFELFNGTKINRLIKVFDSIHPSAMHVWGSIWFHWNHQFGGGKH